MSDIVSRLYWLADAIEKINSDNPDFLRMIAEEIRGISSSVETYEKTRKQEQKAIL